MLKIPPHTERRPPRLIPALATALVIGALAFAFSFEGCATMAIRPDSRRYRKPVVVKMTVTGYCNCRKCCGWRYTWYGKPVYDKSGKTKKVLKVGDVEIDVETDQVTVKGQPTEFTQLEYKILYMLMQNAGQTLTRDQIMDRIWDIAGNFVEDNTLTVYIKRIRQKLGNSDIIKTVKGTGYRAEDPADPEKLASNVGEIDD